MLTESTALRKDQRNAKNLETLQHRHYAVIAGIIHRMPADQRAQTATHFARELTATNPKFSRSRFMTACTAEQN